MLPSCRSSADLSFTVKEEEAKASGGRTSRPRTANRQMGMYADAGSSSQEEDFGLAEDGELYCCLHSPTIIQGLSLCRVMH